MRFGFGADAFGSGFAAVGFCVVAASFCASREESMVWDGGNPAGEPGSSDGEPEPTALFGSFPPNV
jgi:hypothetical protein